MTQAELAKKLNYSDKAVSKWERGEAIPELPVLKQIADMFNVTIDTLISESPQEKPKNRLFMMKKRLIISLLFFGLVWLIAIVSYSVLRMVDSNIFKTWLIYIYAIPVSTAVFLVFSAIWGKNLITRVCISILIWSSILSIYLSLKYYLPNPPNELWLVFIIGIPLQILTMLLFSYTKLSIFNKLKQKK